MCVCVCVCVLCSEELTAIKAALGARIRQLQSELKSKQGRGVRNIMYYFEH